MFVVGFCCVNERSVHAAVMVKLPIVVGLLLFAASVKALDFPSLSHLKAKSDPDVQSFTVREMIGRLVPTHSHLFSVTIDPTIGPSNKDTFQLENGEAPGTVSMTGTSGVAAAWGFYYYLSQYCGCHISWAGDQVSLPQSLPRLSAPVKVTSNDRFRYYQNVCTVSYSFVWWTWERWEKEIDWMAMNGINLPLAFNAQEAIWQRVYLKMGFTQEELDTHFGGAAFLAWSRMGNMQGWGGPEPQSWHIQQVALQHRILQRMRDFGIIPVLPAFAGHVPDAISRLYPNVNTTKNGDWGNFDAPFCCTKLLNTEDPLFTQIGKAFITEYIAEFGTDHIYNADTFNELTPSSSDPAYLKSAGEAVYRAMTAADPDAIWLMQGWLFEDSGFWKPPQAQALLTSVPQGHMIVLDLFSENSPQYERLSSFFGQPFIWCMLHNFGGTVAMYGKLESVNEGPFTARKMANSTMIGTGLTPEGINQNNVMYEFMNENSWRTKPRNISFWISDYADRRYGKINDFVETGWQLLKFGVYNCTTGYGDFCGNVIVSTRPQVDPPLNPAVWYQPEDLYKAWDFFLLGAMDLADSSLFLYDLVDVSRQSLQVIAIKYYTDIIKYYKAKDQKNMMTAAGMLLDLLSDLDTLLATDQHFLLGQWIRDARYWGTSQNESNLFEYNARNQVTLWGPTGNILDYACKQWAGLMKHYYLPRWELFVEQLHVSLSTGKPYNQSQFNQDVLSKVEQPFTFDTSPIPAEPTGDQIEVAQALNKKYRPMTIANAEFFQRLPIFSKQGKKFVKYSTKWMVHNNKIRNTAGIKKFNKHNEAGKYHQIL